MIILLRYSQKAPSYSISRWWENCENCERSDWPPRVCISGRIHQFLPQSIRRNKLLEANNIMCLMCCCNLMKHYPGVGTTCNQNFLWALVIDFWILYYFIASPCFTRMRDRWKSSGNIINVVPLIFDLILERNNLLQCSVWSALFAVLSVTSDHAPCVTLWHCWDLVISWNRMGGASPGACLWLCHKGLLSNHGNILELFIRKEW